MTLVCAVAMALTLTFAGGSGLGQVAARPFVSVMEDGKLRAGFQPGLSPIADVLASPSRIEITVMRKDVRLTDGQIVTGFGFNGWQEGNAVRVVVSALIPADGSNRYVEVAKGVRPAFRKREFARFAVTVGESHAVEEMKALGLEPIVVRVDPTKPAFW